MSRAINPELRGRVGKLLRLLGSDKEGEMLAATAALRRTLHGAGADLHDLAESIEGTANGKKFTEEDAQKIYQAGVEDGRREAEANTGFHSVDDDGPPWHAIAQECAERLDRMRDERERQFVQDMVRRTVRGGTPTEKQAKWLRDIYTRVRR
jgi:hypothetical protein